uniref:GTPase n=1 Tax=Fervidobacterium pennivorans TaxID=93466 RepID=A0A832IJN7_FERPE
MRRLYEIKSVGKDFSIVLNKRDLRAEAEVFEIANKIEETLFETLSERKSVIVTSMFDNEGVKKIIESINPEKLFEDIFQTKVKYVYFDTIETINTFIAGMKKSSEEVRAAIEKMRKSIDEIQRKEEEIISDIRAKYSGTNINNIIDAVASDLRESVDELTDTIFYKGQNEFIRQVNEIVRIRLISELKKLFSDVGKNIVENIKPKLYDVNLAITSINSNSAWIQELIDEILYVTSNLGNLLTMKKRKTDTETIAKVTTGIIGVLSILTNILKPVIEVLLFFLPSILLKFTEKLQKEHIKNAIVTQVIPAVKRKLREELTDLIGEQIEEMVKSISSAFEEEIMKKTAELEAIENEKNKQIEEIETKIKCYNDIKTKIQSLAEPLFF